MYKKILKCSIMLLIGIFIISGFTGCTKKKPSVSEKEALKPQDAQQSEVTKTPEEELKENIEKSTMEETESEESREPPSQTAEEPKDSLDKLSNEKYGWGLVPKTDGTLPDVPNRWKELLQKYESYYHGNTALTEVYLTFDEGYEGGYTSQILDILKENNIKAAFFITGYYLDKNEELVKRMLNEGHIVGNHSVNHPSMPTLSIEEMKREIEELSEKYENVTGRKMKYFRPPMGEFSERSLALTQSLGYKTIFWSIALRDWEPLPGGPEESYNTVINRLHNGAIILLHAVSKDNTIALPRIIATIKEKGYVFKSLDELSQ